TYNEQSRPITCIEELPNELFYEIFEYLDGCDIYKAFSKLNARFHHLINNSPIPLKIQVAFKSESESESELKYYCKNVNLPSRNRIVSLYLFKEFFIDEFFRYCIIDASFISLEFIDLIDISSAKLLVLLSYLKSLPRLFSLSAHVDKQELVQSDILLENGDPKHYLAVLNNKITKVNLKNMVTVEEVKFFFLLCKRMQYFQVNIPNESLANELLLDVFEYLDFLNIFRAFHGLNYRFNQLTFNERQVYHLDFRSISKYDFDIICRPYLSYIQDRIVSLDLSDDYRTPDLPQIFLSCGYRINQFINLKSLTISFYSFAVLKQTIFECRELLHLTHLHIHTNNNHDIEKNSRDLIDKIWNLPKLSHCYLDIKYSQSVWFIPISKISQSIHYLSTIGTSYNLNGLLNLFEQAPNLKRLDMGDFSEDHDTQLMQTNFSSLISLSMSTSISKESMELLFQVIPNLCYLTIQLDNTYLDGHAWEQILIKYLKNIKRFRLKMTIGLGSHKDIAEQIDELLDSFRTAFWIEQHRWFVRCDWDPNDIYPKAILYTLPYAFDSFSYVGGNQSKSTCPNDLDYSFYDHVHTLEHVDNTNYDLNNLTFLPIRCINVRHLKIKFPLHDHFWSLLPRLDRLTSLDVGLNDDSDYTQLQQLLDQASHLDTLRFCHMRKFSMKSFNINSKSIQGLEFFQNSEFRFRYFNSEECAILANTAFASQCKFLAIDVKNRRDIIALVNAMPNLQALSILCEDNKKNQHQPIEENDSLIQWLHDHLLLPYTYSITRKGYTNVPLINLWFNRGV
ncbi:unnamed protein product, partial [Adineta steineri]